MDNFQYMSQFDEYFKITQDSKPMGTKTTTLTIKSVHTHFYEDVTLV